MIETLLSFSIFEKKNKTLVLRVLSFALKQKKTKLEMEILRKMIETLLSFSILEKKTKLEGLKCCLFDGVTKRQNSREKDKTLDLQVLSFSPKQKKTKVFKPFHATFPFLVFYFSILEKQTKLEGLDFCLFADVNKNKTIEKRQNYLEKGKNLCFFLFISN